MTEVYYVYVLASETAPGRHYIGIAKDLDERLGRHNRGEVPHTSKFAPWRVEVAARFADKAKAHAFERYLKSGSGRAFAKRHF